MKKLLFSMGFALFTISLSFAQEMQKGFSFLETGKYKEAVPFFEKVLKEYPTNKTAKLCYGRAVGLNGDAKKAVGIFTELLEKYPNDFEIKLNYAESLLWSSQFGIAEDYYKNLITEDPKSFAGLLGYANTLSNLKKYDDALLYVDKALDVLPGNENALVSKKYMHLGAASVAVQNQNYTLAEEFLQKNLVLFKNDKETLLNLVNLYVIAKKFEDAKSVYKKLAITKKDSVSSLNGLALVAHLQDKNKDALLISESAVEKVKKVNDTLIQNQTTERYVQALIWNKKYKQAEKIINELVVEKPNTNWILSLRATLNIYTSNFKKTVKDYNTMLANDKASFDGNLGKANALKALGRYTDAYDAAQTTLIYYDKQKDATNFIQQLQKSFTPFAESKTAYSFDNGDNHTVFTDLNIEFPISTKFKLKTNYSYRTTENSNTTNNAQSNNFQLGLSHQWHPNVVFNILAGISATQAETTTSGKKNYDQFLTDIFFNLKPAKLQTLDIGYRRELESFNADLLDKSFVKNNYYANYNLSTTFNLGWFTQYFYTTQNDGNVRNLLFTSLYYNILTKPILKTGVNFQNISFKNQVPTDYFSPEKFKAYEIFINLLKDEDNSEKKSVFYDLNAATGLQYIEDEDAQSTYRVQFKLGYKFSENMLANVYGTKSNIASAVVTGGSGGFTYTEIGFRLKWYFLNKPLFQIK